MSLSHIFNDLLKMENPFLACGQHKNRLDIRFTDYSSLISANDTKMEGHSGIKVLDISGACDFSMDQATES
jgi:hypothetical protein